MNRLFGDFFYNLLGFFLGVVETILGGVGEGFEEENEANQKEKHRIISRIKCRNT